jgi:endonuclease-3 related protein
VEKAIRNLKTAKVLTPRKLLGIRPQRLAQLIRPAGYFNVKTVRLKEFLKYLKRKNCLGNFKPFARIGTETLRKELLGVKGIGPETCDSILLYALDRPVFVADAYTKRIFSRGGFFKDSSTYHEIQDLFKDRLPTSRRLFNEYHALIVRLGKQFCRPQARCEGCPLA